MSEFAPPFSLEGDDDAADRVHEFARGERPGFFGSAFQLLESLPLERPSTLRIEFDDPFGPDTEELVIAWDNATAFTGKKTFKEGTTVIIPIEQRLGSRVELWATDNVPAKVSVHPLSSESSLRAKEEQKAESKKGIADVLTEATSGLNEKLANRLILAGALLVVGAVVYFKFLKD